MARKNVTKEPSTYRVMVEKNPYKQVSINFADREEALQYAHELTSKDTAWYGIYELNPLCDYLITVESKRLVTHDNSVPINIKPDKLPKLKRKEK
jgi:hypothetical protein